MCARIGAAGAELIGGDAVVLTHCNAGALATGGHGHRARAGLHAAPGRAPRVRGRRRDPAAAPGQPAHRVGARPGRRAGDRHRRRHGRQPAPPGRRELRHRRRRPDRGQRRRRQQDRHLWRGARGAGARRAVLRGRAHLDDRPGHRRRRGHPDRGAGRGRGQRLARTGRGAAPACGCGTRPST